MARAFFDELNDALVGLVPDDVGRYSARVTGHNVKVWFDEEREHYEAQALSGGRFEVGFHAEHRQPAASTGPQPP